jgi:hypothetical protein
MTQEQAIALGSAGVLQKVSKGPRPPNTKAIKFENATTEFACGLYILTASTAVGKSVIGRAICVAAVQSGWTEVGQIYVFEPGAPEYPKLTAGDNVENYFGKAAVFFTEGGGGSLPDFLSTTGFLKERVGTDTPALLLVDSISDALKSFSPEGRIGAGTFEQGMQTMDRVFVEQLNNFAEKYSLVMIGVVSSDMIPFVSKLFGSCQGSIIAAGPKQFLKKQRSSGRLDEMLMITKDQLQAAVAALNYPEKLDDNYVFGGLITA